MKPGDRQEYEPLLRAGLWFGRLPEPLRDAILDRSRVRSYPRGSMIQGEESRPEALFAVLEGQVALGRWADGDQEVLIYVGSPGMWFGELGLLLGTKTWLTATAHADARVLALSRADFDGLVRGDPESYRWFARLGLERYGLMVRAFAESRVFTASDLLLARLSDLAEMRRKDHPSEGVVELELTQADLAALTGLSRQTANAVLHRLEERGLVELSFRKIRIPEPARLRDELGDEGLVETEHKEPWAAAFSYG